MNTRRRLPRLKRECTRKHVLCFLLIVELWTSAAQSTSTRSTFFKTTANRLQTTYTQFETLSALTCAAACTRDNVCNSVNYQETTRLCELSELALMHVDLNRHSSTGWVTFSNSGAQDWILLFQAIPDIGTDPYIAWTLGTNVTTDDVHCMGSDVTLCSKHFRSVLVDLWHGLGNFELKLSLWKNETEAAYITFSGTGSNLDDWFSHERVVASTWTVLRDPTVKLSVWKNETEAAYITFSGTGSNLDDWFTHDRVISSTWTVLADPTVSIFIFSMEGVFNRRFYISRHWNGCDDDPAVLIVKNDVNHCNYDVHPSYPRFLYSVSDSWANVYYASEYDLADAMRISIRLL